MRKLIRTAGVALGTSAVGLLLTAGPVLAQTGSGSETTTTTGAGSGSGPTDTGGSTSTTASTVLGTDTTDAGDVGGADILPKTGGPEAALLIGAGGLLGTAVGARFLLRRRQPASS